MKNWVAILLFVAVFGAHADVLPDPTRPTPSGVPGNTHVGDRYRLESILVSPVRRQAVIDGRLVRVGDGVGRAVVVRIDPDAVWLRRRGRSLGLRLVAGPSVQTIHNDKNAGGTHD